MHYARVKRRGSPFITLTNYDKPPKYKSLKHYLAGSFTKGSASDCWIWTRSFKQYGYGNAWWEGKHHVAHRLVYEFFIGKIPKGLNACHKCDNPACVNPSHIFLGTSEENNLDRKLKGRNADTKGSKNPFSKLNEEQVKDIKSRLNQGEKGAAIGLMYGVSKHAIWRIKAGKNWSHIKV